MNFLAHALLSGEDGDVLLGNLMADFLRPGVPAPDLAGVRRGVARHHRIDHFTDAHPLVAGSRARLFPRYRHYSAVLVDVFYDHLLARNWSRFHAQPLPIFAAGVYETLNERRELLPPSMQSVVPAMIADDWLCSYERPDGVRYALSRMERRMTRGNIGGAWDEFSRELPAYEREFLAFFPQLIAALDEDSTRAPSDG